MKRLLRTMILCLAPFCFSAAQAANVEYIGFKHRDPFADQGGGITLKDEIRGLGLTLDGVVWNSDRPQAIISGTVVKEGAKINKAEVLEIKKDGVKMRYKQQVFILRPGRKG